MELSELFLMAWAMIVTGIAVYYHHVAKQFKHRVMLFELSLLAIAHNKAEVVMNGDTVQVRGV